YGMIVILLLLCALFSVLTIAEQAGGADGGERLARILIELSQSDKPFDVLIVVGHGQADGQFADALQAELQSAEIRVVRVPRGHPRDGRLALEKAQRERNASDSPLVVAASPRASRWAWLEKVSTPVHTQPSYRFPNFLKTDNLRNIANQIAVIAILA